jgi:hypothetical protein
LFVCFSKKSATDNSPGATTSCPSTTQDTCEACPEIFVTPFSACGPSPPPGPAPPPSPPATTCEPNKHGPPCKTDTDCSNVPKCVRCAHSGYCTDIPL